MDACPAPHPNPRAPRLKLPAGACDCHFHVFGPASTYPYAEPRSYTPPDSPLPHYLRLLDTLGVDRAVLVHPSVYGPDHSTLYDTLAEVGGRFRGVAVIGPDVTEVELQRLNAAGVRGTRFNLVSKGGLPVSALAEVAERIATVGWHLQLFTDLEQIAELESVLRGLPVPVVVDHMGHIQAGTETRAPGWQALLRLLGEGKAWVKLSAPYRQSKQEAPFADLLPYARALIAANPEHCVWGTDWPHPGFAALPMPDDGDLVDVLADWAPDEAQRKKILVDNPARLYGF